MSLKLSAAPFLATALLFAAAAAANAQTGLAVGTCVIADKLNPGVITGTIQNGYKVRDDRYGMEMNWPASTIVVAPCAAPKAAPAAKAATPAPKVIATAAPQTPAPKAAPPKAASAPSAAPRNGKYHCVFFINGSLQTVPGFTLTGGRYTHQNGGGGTAKAAGGVIEFSGGPLTGQAGKIDGNKVRLFNESRSRTVIDCDTKG